MILGYMINASSDLHLFVFTKVRSSHSLYKLKFVETKWVERNTQNAFFCFVDRTDHAFHVSDDFACFVLFFFSPIHREFLLLDVLSACFPLCCWKMWLPRWQTGNWSAQGKLCIERLMGKGGVGGVSFIAIAIHLNFPLWHDSYGM